MHRDDETILMVMIFFIIPILFLLLLTLPMLIFYVVPCLASAFVLGKLWAFGCRYKLANQRRVAGLIAATAVVLVLTVGFPHPIMVGADGKVAVENPGLYRAYNGCKSEVEGLINWSWLKYFRPWLPNLIPPKVYEPVLYDLRDLAWMLWIGAFIGAPFVFLRQGHKEDREYIRNLRTDYKAKIEIANRENFRLRRDNGELRKWSDEAIAARDEEISKLKVVAAQVLGPPEPPPPAPGSGALPSEKPGGVFSSEAL